MIFATVTGRVTKDAEQRFTSSGSAVLGFTVATDVGFGDNKKTEFINCSLWGKRGEALAMYILKGGPVTVVGSLEKREWESNGKSGVSLELNVQEIELQGKGGGEKPQNDGFRKPEPTQKTKADNDFADDSIPF